MLKTILQPFHLVVDIISYSKHSQSKRVSTAQAGLKNSYSNDMNRDLMKQLCSQLLIAQVVDLIKDRKKGKSNWSLLCCKLDK